VLLIFSITLTIGTALTYYKKAGVPPDWSVIGGALRAAFNDVLQEEKYQDDGEWARKTFKRYEKMWASKQLVYAGMVSALRRKFLDNCKDESILIPNDYFEKLRSSTMAKVRLYLPDDAVDCTKNIKLDPIKPLLALFDEFLNATCWYQGNGVRRGLSPRQSVSEEKSRTG